MGAVVLLGIHDRPAGRQVHGGVRQGQPHHPRSRDPRYHDPAAAAVARRKPCGAMLREGTIATGVSTALAACVSDGHNDAAAAADAEVGGRSAFVRP
jgi:hypothetical protein